jgi:hypothetical protein
MPGRAVGEAVSVQGGRVGSGVAVITGRLTGVAPSAAGVPVATGAGSGVALFVAAPKGRVQVGTAVRTG